MELVDNPDTENTKKHWADKFRALVEKHNIDSSAFADIGALRRSHASVDEIIRKTDPEELIQLAMNTAEMLHNSFDRRARLTTDSDGLQKLLTLGSLKRNASQPGSVRELLLKRDYAMGVGHNVEESKRPISVDLVHVSDLDKVNQGLWNRGTRVGSEEFTDTGKGIQIILHDNAADRIKYGFQDAYENEFPYVDLESVDTRAIAAAVFAQLSDMTDENGLNYIKDIVQTAIDGDYSRLTQSKGSSAYEGYLLGGVSLNDVEHVKIPVSELDLTNYAIKPNDVDFGLYALKPQLRKLGLNEEQVQSFIDAGGPIGGGLNPQGLIKVQQYRAARDTKAKLLSSGVSDVIFTNPEGIDIMAAATYGPGKNAARDTETLLLQKARGEITKLLTEAVGKIKKGKNTKAAI